MELLLVAANHYAQREHSQGKKLTSELIDKLQTKFHQVIAEGLAYHAKQPALKGRKQRKGKNLLDRLIKYEKAVLLFMHDLEVPFTNNLAERDIRPAKLQQKVSGCFRSTAGAKAYATILSYICTARKQGWNILEAITQACRGDPMMLALDDS